MLKEYNYKVTVNVLHKQVQKMDESVKREVESLKRSFNDWVLFLDEDQRDTKSYVRELERRVRELESKNKY